MFIDEHEKSIDDGAFIILHTDPPDSLKQDGSIGQGPSDANSWFGLPADRHNQGANLSFADAHVESRHWKAPKIFKLGGQPAAPGGDLQDLRYLQSVIPRLR